jgi:hypothetical protein
MMGQENYRQSTYLTNLAILAILAIFGYLKKKKFPQNMTTLSHLFPKKSFIQITIPSLFFCRQVIKISPQRNIDHDIIKI